MHLAQAISISGGFNYVPFERLIARCERDWAKCHCARCGKALAHVGSPGRKCPDCRNIGPTPTGTITITFTPEDTDEQRT